MLKLRSGKNEFRKRFKASLRREWYPTLKILRELEDAGPQRDGLTEAWQSFGEAMDLDEVREKQEYEVECRRAADRRCSWDKCDYHAKRPPKTRVCVGCNEVVGFFSAVTQAIADGLANLAEVLLKSVPEDVKHHLFRNSAPVLT